MKKFFSKRSGAIITAVVVILLATYFGSYRSLGVAVREVKDGFSDGVTYTDDTGSTYLHKSIRSQLINRAEASTSLVSLANNFPEVEAETAALRDASNNIKNLIYGNGTPSELCRANKELDRCFYALFDEIEQLELELDGRDKTNLDSVKTEMSGAAGEIENSGYNESVRAFDRSTLSVFPTNIIKKICFIDDPELFE